MIAYIIGKADNHELIFKRNQAGQWQCTVPFENDGQYVLTLFAVDEAGNESYYSKVLFVVDTKSLYSHIYPLKYYLNKQEKETFENILFQNSYYVDVLKADYSFNLYSKPYECKFFSCSLL